MNTMHNFSSAKQRAIQQMREMNKRSSPQVKTESPKKREILHKQPLFSLQNFSFPLSDDELLFLGLIMILSKDCDDTWLFLALFYIFL